MSAATTVEPSGVLRRVARALGLTPLPARIENRLLDRRCSEILGRVAHETRQPLGAAVVASQVIRRSSDPARRERACEVLDRQLERLSRLLDDLIEASRVGLDKTILRMQRLDLRRVVEDVVEDVQPQLAGKRQFLEVRVPADPIWMHADSARLEQVVSNLLVNGIKYTPPGGSLWIELTQNTREAVLAVCDTGEGIPADFLPHIFEPFVTGHIVRETGLGVGLAISRQLVELHGGTIRASSGGTGCGTEFVVTLPTERRARSRDGASGH